MIEKEKERIDDEGIDLLNLLLNLWNHKLLILVLACIAALFMFVKTAFSQILPILLICDEYGVLLFEDAAESLGATYKGKQTGTFGKYGIFSFHLLPPLIVLGVHLLHQAHKDQDDHCQDQRDGTSKVPVTYGNKL